jgi:hypothetical protein
MEGNQLCVSAFGICVKCLDLMVKKTNLLCILDVQVQFLDRQHLLIKFGSVDGGVSSL